MFPLFCGIFLSISQHRGEQCSCHPLTWSRSSGLAPFFCASDPPLCPLLLLHISWRLSLQLVPWWVYGLLSVFQQLPKLHVWGFCWESWITVNGKILEAAWLLSFLRTSLKRILTTFWIGGSEVQNIVQVSNYLVLFCYAELRLIEKTNSFTSFFSIIERKNVRYYVWIVD